jgi:hypothetical protein
VTSTFLPAAGLMGAGAGIIDVLAAAELLETNRVATVSIGGERAIVTGLYVERRIVRRLTSAIGSRRVLARTQIASDKAALWASDSIVWGNATDSIVWGNATDSIVWGDATDSIVWGDATDSIVWGDATDSIVWGDATDSIVWGDSTDSIVWGDWTS